MKKVFMIFLLGGVTLFSACGGEEEKKEEPKSETPTQPETTTPEAVCHYELDASSVNVIWTAYKLTEKVGVGGGFDSVTVEGFNTEATDLANALVGVQLNMYVSSTNTSNAERDVKIKDSFFGTMADTEVITGTVSSAAMGEHENQGSCVVSLTMNGNTNDVDFLWNWENGEILMKSNVNVPDWDAQGALDALNAVCSELHKGEDGESVLWPDVEVTVKASIAENCQ